MSHLLAQASIALALVALAMGIVVRFKTRGGTLPSKYLTNALILLPLSVVIGTSPRALDLQNEAISISASVVSLALTVMAVVLLRRQNRA
jgi:hypothetical protein